MVFVVAVPPADICIQYRLYFLCRKENSLGKFVCVPVTELLKLCDELRDDTLPELGVRLEDRDGKVKK